MAGPSSDLIGGGCADYAALHPNGPASVTGMAQDPVATAASNNPLLSTLTAALSGKLNPNVNLVDTLNSGQYTVFAPTNAAFDKLPAGTIDELKTNSEMLKSILTYHVVQEQESPNTVDGTHKTLQGADVKVAGQGNGQRDGVHDRHCADAAQPVTAYTVPSDKAARSAGLPCRIVGPRGLYPSMRDVVANSNYVVSRADRSAWRPHYRHFAVHPARPSGGLLLRHSKFRHTEC
jgi:uncharacterized surface protein with fasciclin (FAS1) repeats